MVIRSEDDSRICYEDALRIIGRHLDRAPSYHVSVVEGTDGFCARWYAALHQTESQMLQFSWEKLADLEVFNSAARNSRRRPDRHRGMRHTFPDGHEDALRALGHELDALGARDVSLDEVPDGLAVSYVWQAVAGNQTVKAYRIFGPEQMEALCEEAQTRRRTSRHRAV